jgi:predicted MFS family arabinose efflux permease
LMTGFVTVYGLMGPPIGAVLFAVARPLPFIGQAVLVAAGAGLVTQVKLSRRETKEGEAEATARSVAREIAAGFHWALHNDAIRTLVVTIFAFNITYGAAWAVLVLYAKERLGMGAVGFGLLTTAAAVGGILGNIAYGWITKHVTLGNIMRIGLIIETFTHLSLALTTVPAVAIAIMVVFGAHAFIWGTTSITVRQRAVPEPLRGRVASVNNLGVYGGLVIGAGIGGPIADRWGITAPFWFAFIGSAVFVVLIWRQLRYIAHDDVVDPLSPDPSSPDPASPAASSSETTPTA